MQKLKTSTGVDLDKYDYESLKATVKPQTIWVVQLERGPVLDPKTRQPLPLDDIPNTPGAVPTFTLYVYDEKGSFRATHDVEHLPQPADLLLKFLHLADEAKPFLDSLSPPMTWRFETAAEAEFVTHGVYQKSTEVAQASGKLAAEAKDRGAAAMKRRDKAQAIAEYTTAIEQWERAITQKLSAEDEKDVLAKLAICHANRAAARLLDPSASDLKEVLKDGQAAVHYKPDYAKGYARQSAALTRMGRTEEAMDILAKALRRPALAEEEGLVDMLIDLQTGGRGLSTDEATFKQWLIDLTINDRASADRVLDLKGAWHRRLNDHMARWKKT
ncbi:hypothetical protein K525DRAFT_208944 [Schizophyllum commune Loenen D]|nr:hypothetical protein K525DRAFT_208944 [Schizophyllum commune Loenen D]